MSRAINSSMLHNGCARYSFRVRPNDLFIRTGRATSISRICSLSSGLQHDQYIKNVGAFTSTSRSRNLTTFAPASAGSAIVSPTSSQEIDINVDTIYALSTGAGVRAGIAIVRISGPACLPIYQALCPSKHPPKGRYATLQTLLDPADNQIILDSGALVLFFPGPNTVTGDNVLELHIHGGPATVKAVLSAIPRCSSNTRMAEPGEFTRRAFQNGRLDLAQVEALSDTLAAETEQQRRAAVRGNSRKLGETYDGWREQLLYARGELEALIDFSEDQHFDESPAELLGNVTTQVRDMVRAIDQHEYASQRGDLLRRGVEIALIGPPNAGKSSLLNLIVGREASIVSSEAGTTRDIVEVRYDIGGYLCTFADTAGLRKAKDKLDVNSTAVVGDIEQEGIKRAKARAGDSDLIIVLASIEQTQSYSDPRTQWNIQYDAESLANLYTDGGEPHKPSIIVVNKCDAASPELVSDLIRGFQKDLMQRFHLRDASLISGISCLEATTDTNSRGKDPGHIRMFTTQLTRVIESMTNIPAGSEDLLGVTERQRQLLSTCKEHLMAFISEASTGMSSEEEAIETDIVIAAEHLRSAADCLSRITGRGLAGDVEEVLGVVFEKFCVGK